MMTPRIPQLLAGLALLAMASPLAAQTSRSTTTSNASRSTSSTSRPSSSTTSNYNRSSSNTSQYPSNTMMGNALIQIDPETRSVVVISDDETHAAVEKVIASLDHPKPQVLIKVVFIEVTLDKNLNVGIEGNYNLNIGHAAGTGVSTTTTSKSSGSTTTQTVTTSTNAASSVASGVGTAGTLFGLAADNTAKGVFGQVTSDNWNATLHLLASNGKAQVLSRPSIMARNNQQAVIVVGQEVPLVTSSQITDQGQTINSITYKDVGIILRVTPFITSDKTVEMIVAPEISSLSEQTVQVSAGVNAPVINKRSAETVVVTPNATTVVIGGLMQKQLTSTVEKVPILGDIPLLGHAFRHTVKGESRSELLIFLTPYIVEGNQTLKDVSLNEANHAELIRETLTPEDVKNNLDTLRLMPQLDPACPPKIQTETTIIETTPAPAKKRKP